MNGSLAAIALCGLLLVGGVAILPAESTRLTATTPVAGPLVVAPRPGTMLFTNASPEDWPTYLDNPERTGANSYERTIAATNVSQLRELWSVASNGSDFSAPIVVNNTVYYGSWNGYEYAINAINGSVEWSRFLGTDPCGGYDPMGISSTPAYLNGTLYLGGADGYWYALNASNGEVEWRFLAGSQANNYYDWASALVYHDSLYIGLASCFDNPLIVGQLLEVNLTGNHTVSHSFNVVPATTVGGSIWTTPAVDTATNTVWVTTGNEESGYPPYVNAVLALNATTLNLTGSWQVPNVAGQDSDFGSTPNLIETAAGLSLVVATNKNGVTYALNRTNASTGGSWGPSWSLATGGAFSSGAFDGTTLYLSGGAELYGVDPTNGNVSWNTTLAGGVTGSLAWANGLVYVGAGSNAEAIDAANGTVLWDYPLPGGQSTVTEPVVDNGQLYVTSGDYGTLGYLTAFGLNYSAGANASSLTGRVPLTPAFSATAHGGLDPYRFSWQFGDGGTAQGPRPLHTYTVAGNYTAEVWVNDSAGRSYFASYAVDAERPPTDPGLTAVIFASPPVGVAPLSVAFGGSEQNGTFSPYNFTWSFGDGTGGFGAGLDHTYLSAGTFPVTLTVLDAVGNSATALSSIEVVAPLSVRAIVGPNNTTVGQAVEVSAQVTGGLAPFTYAWDFGDASSGSNLSSLYHTYLADGNYTVTVVVTDSLRERNTSSATEEVITLPGPLLVSATYQYSGGAPCGHASGSPLAVNLEGSASGGVGPYQFSWTFNDGSTAAGANVTRAATPSLTSANLTVTDAKGTTNSTRVTFGPLVSSCPPSVASSSSDTALLLGIGAGLLVLAVVVGILFALRRREGGAPPP